MKTTDTFASTMNELRRSIEFDGWDEIDVHYVVCQIIATHAVCKELTKSQVMDILEGVKDDLEEMDYDYNDNHCGGALDCDGCDDPDCEA